MKENNKLQVYYEERRMILPTAIPIMESIQL